MPGRRENDRWVPPKQARQLETLTAEIIHGRWQLNVGSQKANTRRPALLTRWVGLRWRDRWIPVFLELSDAPEYRKGGPKSNEKWAT
jgi:hypothetical protein